MDRKEMLVKFSWNMKGNNHIGSLDIDERIMLKFVLNE
jgi:hypothetical protein